MIWVYRRVTVKNDLVGQHASQVDHMYNNYLGIYPFLKHHLTKQPGTPDMPYFPSPLPLSRSPGRNFGYDRPTRNAPGGSFPLGSAGAGGSTGMGCIDISTYQQPRWLQLFSSTDRANDVCFGTDVIQMFICSQLFCYTFLVGHLVPLSGIFELPTYLVMYCKLSPILASTILSDTPLNLKITALAESLSIIALFLVC